MVTRRLAWLMRRGGQQVLALTVLVALGVGHYVLSRLPVPVMVENAGPFEAGATSEFVIDQTLERPGLLLVFEGEAGDAVDLRFDRARLQESTVRLLERLGVTLPAGDHPVSLLTGRAEKAKTFLRVSVVPIPGQASRVTLKTPREAGDSGLALVLRADGARIAMSALSAGDPSPDAPPPQRMLRLDGQQLPLLSGAVPLSMLAAAGSEIRLRITPAVGGWENVQRLALAPADQRDAALSAFGMGVRAGRESQFSDYACAAGSRLPLAHPGRLADGRCAAGKARLRLVSLGFRPGLVSAQASGLAWARKGGAVHTLDLVAWLKENPILATLIGALDAAVLAWCKQVFFGGGGGGGGWRLGEGGDGAGHRTPSPPARGRRIRNPVVKMAEKHRP